MHNPEKTGLLFETIALTYFFKTVRTSRKWESQITNTENSACARVLEKGAGSNNEAVPGA